MSSQANNGLTHDDNSRIKVEFAVNVSTEDDLEKIRKALGSRNIELVSSDLQSKSMQIGLSHKVNDSELNNVQALQRFIEEQTGILTVVKGLGSLDSAVAELKPPNKPVKGGQQVMGIVRVSQVANNHCFFDGSIDGFAPDIAPGKYSLAIHEFGDLSSDTYDTLGEKIVHIDDQMVENNFKLMSIRKIVPNCIVARMIGLSVALSSQSHEHPPEKQILTAGVLARASTIQENKKQFCSCSGKTLWEERKERQQRE